MHVNGSTQIVRDLVLLAVELSTIVHPAAKDGSDGQIQLHIRILWETDLSAHNQLGILFGIDALREDRLEFANQCFKIFCGQIVIALDTAGDLLGGDGVLKKIAVDIHDYFREHLDEAAIAVPGKARILCLGDKPLNRAVIETKVQHGVHHARHAERCARTDAYK